MNPNLKYKLDIINTCEFVGGNDIFEVFNSIHDKKVYIIHQNGLNLEVFDIFANKTINTLKGHKNNPMSIRYFMDNKNSKEYLISADTDKVVIVWDIDEKYNIKYKINTGYGDRNYIFSCLLVFPHNNNHIIIRFQGKELLNLQKFS